MSYYLGLKGHHRGGFNAQHHHSNRIMARRSGRHHHAQSTPARRRVHILPQTPTHRRSHRRLFLPLLSGLLPHTSQPSQGMIMDDNPNRQYALLRVERLKQKLVTLQAVPWDHTKEIKSTKTTLRRWLRAFPDIDPDFLLSITRHSR